jgi:RNA polymerase sigma-70 factor (ECF subfamily)
MSANPDDVELMARVAGADAGAQRALVRRLLRRVERLCRALLRHREDAQDATQLCIVEILKSARSFRGESSLERWSDRITARTALRAAAAERRAQRAPIDLRPSGSVPASGDSSVLAREYLDRLSERQRSVLVLRHGFEFSIEEIAELEGISPNTVKDRLLRGRNRVRGMLRKDHAAHEASTRDED